MASETYVIRVSSFGHMVNRQAVEKAALEGRTVPPVVEYLPQGSKVDLDSDSPRTGELVLAGAIATEGQAKRLDELDVRRRELEAEAAQLRAQAAQVGVEDPSGFDVEGADKDALEAEAGRLELQPQGTGSDGAVLVDDLRDAIRSHSGG